MADNELEVKRNLIQILDEVLCEGVWTGSLFLETSGKKVQDLRDRLIKDFNLENDEVINANDAADNPSIPIGSAEIYISLYQTSGQNLKKWESLLSSINNYSSGRPIYRTEEDMKSFLRPKENQQNDGYAVVYVNASDILKPPANKPLLDKSGRELLIVKEGTIRSQNIVRFVHMTGQYRFEKGVLVKASAGNI